VIILESERLIFREHEPGDLEAYCSMEADPEVRRYVGGGPRPRAQAEERFRNGLLGPSSNLLRLWAAVLKQENRYVGRSGIYPHIGSHGAIPDEAVLSFYIAREYWGRGLATEAGRAFVTFGFEELRLGRIVATVQAGNAASLRVLDKLGFTLTRTEVGPKTFHKFELLNPAADPVLRNHAD